MSWYSVVIRGAAAPAGVIAEDHISEPEPAAQPEPRRCTETTKAGNPCQGTPGDDGLCAAHKPKGDDGGGSVGADQAQGGEAGEGEEKDDAEEEAGS
jgi:hypothetical protein